MVSQYQPRAMTFVLAWYNLISLISHYLICCKPSRNSLLMKTKHFSKGDECRDQCFLRTEKNKLSGDKCVPIHIRKKCGDCEKLFVHEEDIKKSDWVKFFEDYIRENEKQNATISDQVARKYDILVHTFALLNDLPFENFWVVIGQPFRFLMSWLPEGWYV